jgi:RNA polymerase sigma-70 factor (ECF subfamily)
VTIDPGFRELYEREFPAVFRAVFLLCGDRQLAEDAAQEAFARALARWRRLRDQPWAAGWVTTTAFNVARRQLRKRPTMSVGPDAGQESPHDERLDLHAAIRALPTRQQEAVALHYLLDLPVAQTAAAMGCDEGTVKSHLHRARSALNRALFEPDPNDEPTRSSHG